jgi:ribose 1,5-bisphosphokinase
MSVLGTDEPLLAVIGPSGSGKSTVVRELVQAGIVAVTPSWTTRPQRADEQNGTIEHQFVDDAAFDELARAGFFLDVVQPFGLPYRYALPVVRRAEGDAVPTVMMRVAFIPLLLGFYRRPVVYQVEDDLDRARTRVMARGGEVGSRLADHEAERSAGREVADRVFVNTGDLAALAEALTRALAEDFETVRAMQL